jgi:hypothetical protein
MNAPTLEQIAQAVLAWQRRHPLAERLSLDAVHSIGLVALPFLRSGHADDPPTLDQAPRWRQWLRRRRSAGVSAFNERFIDGLSPRRAAAFALRHGVEAVEGVDDWPQRRIAVDNDGAAASRGGWPYELWLATAALEGARGRRRVLVSLREGGALAVTGQRALDPKRLMAAAATLLLLIAALAWSLRGETPPPPDLRVSGAVQAPAASAVPSAPTSPPTAALSPASLPASTVPAASAAASLLPPPEESSEPPIDIRPRLNPLRDGKPRPPLGGGAVAATPATSAATAATAPAAPAATAPASEAAAQVDPERLRPSPAVGQGPTVALVSPVYPTRAEAEDMLQRMRLHVAATLQAGDRVDGEVFELKPGFRAAVWPFGSREEAQIINATMVARGWKTRAVDF